MSKLYIIFRLGNHSRDIICVTSTNEDAKEIIIVELKNNRNKNNRNKNYRNEYDYIIEEVNLFDIESYNKYICKKIINEQKNEINDDLRKLFTVRGNYYIQYDDVVQKKEQIDKEIQELTLKLKQLESS